LIRKQAMPPTLHQQNILKSVHKSADGPLSSLTSHAKSLILPPPDGVRLQDVYDAEMRYMQQMRTGGADARWYDWVPALSLSVSGREALKLGDLSRFLAEPVAIRGTGGTAVPQGPGTINMSVFSHHPRHPGILETYRSLCTALQDGFAALGLQTSIGARPGSFCDGDHNILYQDQKLVGTAQRWAMRADGAAICLHHCVILAGADPDWLCARPEALYDHAGLPIRYDRNAHASIPFNRADLAEAMDKPLQDFIKRAKEDRL
jgi:hypothetical protein